MTKKTQRASKTKKNAPSIEQTPLPMFPALDAIVFTDEEEAALDFIWADLEQTSNAPTTDLQDPATAQTGSAQPASDGPDSAR